MTPSSPNPKLPPLLSQPRGRVILLSPGLRRITTLEALLAPQDVVYGKPKSVLASDVVLAWGRRPSAVKAAQYAAKNQLSVMFVEDGLLRSVELGSGGPPLSVMSDNQGIYFDSSCATQLEGLIKRPVQPRETDRASELISQWRHEKVSKYNYQRDMAVPKTPYVLVIDQTFGDASISGACADERSFDRMLEAALDENPGIDILLKVHPEVIRGRKRGYLNLSGLSSLSRVRVVSDDFHAASLVASACSVYVVSSQLGFEALIWGKPVRVFGMPFYAGWGLTGDDLPPPTRRTSVPLTNLVHAALIEYPTYIDPETKSKCEVERVVAWLGLQRRSMARFPLQLQAVGFSSWKRPYVREFFGGSSVKFVRRVASTSSIGPVVVWGNKYVNELDSDERRKSGKIRLEDGFLRSVGLGADLIRPLSWVQDQVGIYYDATGPSSLETLLKQSLFDAEILARAKQLQKRIVQARLTKYNLSASQIWRREVYMSSVILVPGQVESDASLKFGGSSIRTNLTLLKAVRLGHPDAFIIYKPHPDVIAKLRPAGIDEEQAARWCDLVLENVAVQDVIDGVDEVHTLTSLTGFEALLRGKTVVTYGQPFYAGWGLTDDLALSESTQVRRGRALTLEQLVAGTLLLYPTYVSRITKRFTTAERALDELLDWQKEVRTMPLFRRLLGRIFNII